MIKEINELNFPPYATLDSATVTINDMGDRTISADVKIDGSISPDFSYDWEVEFKGEKYIQPLRKPHALKDNKSLSSTISITFYHWAIYQLKRNFFVELASTHIGTAFADKYVAPLAVNLEEFITAFNNVLSYYFPNGEIYADLNVGDYNTERQYIDISYSYLWDVLQKTYELYSVRWTIEKDSNGNYVIKFGYPASELTHIFEYGFDGGLLKTERQVQNSNIRNKILGRGGSQNLPYLYFKDYDKYSQGGDGNQGMIPDPDAIPELSNIYFTELRNSNFRSYVQGWKTNPNRMLTSVDVLETFDSERADSDYAYMRGATDTKFDPVEYVKDDESISEYGELVGKMENNEEIYPSLQNMDIEIVSPDGTTFVTRADEVVAVEEVTTDAIASDDETLLNEDINIEAGKSHQKQVSITNGTTGQATTELFSSNDFDIPEGYEGTLFNNPILKHIIEIKDRVRMDVNLRGNIISSQRSSGLKRIDGDGATWSFKVIDIASETEVVPINLPAGRYRIDYTVNVQSVTFALGEVYRKVLGNQAIGITYRESIEYIKHFLTMSANIVCKSFNGDVILNKVDGISISQTTTIASNESATLTIIGSDFTVPEQGAILVDVPISVTPQETTIFSEKTIKVIDLSTNEVVPSTNIASGNYRLMVDVTIINKSSDSKNIKVELLPSYLYFVESSEKWEPTFDVWIKNIFNTDKSDYASEVAYVDGVWSPLRTEEDMVLTFSSGLLSGHDNWEFRVKKGGIAYDNSKTIIDENGNEVRSEWRLTLIKSDAELESIRKYIPYKGFNAQAGDFFFFTGIELPHQYVLSSERRLTQYLEDSLIEVKDIKPQWVVSLDKVRANQDGVDNLMDTLSVGSVITLKDKRFTDSVGERQVLQSITYSWANASFLPDVDIVLSDKVTTSLSTVAMLQGKVESLLKQVGGLSNIEQVVRKVGDLLYLRKDGFEDTSYSRTHFADVVSSDNFRPGAIGGTGWGAYTDENGNSIIEADKLFIRNEMQVNSLIVNQIAALGGTKILSAADMTISAVETVILENDVVGERCHFDTKGASKSNLFAVDDIAYSNMFDSENAELKYYKRRVIEVGADYITLSTTDKDGDGEPQVGDVVVQFGNFTDTSRQSFIIIEPLNGGLIEVFSGVDSFNISERNMIGFGVKQETNEAFLYGYGDIFFGERSGLGDYISYDKSTGDLKIKAQVAFEAGSSGLENVMGDINVGAQNMLRNSGFTGDYLSERIADEMVLDATSELFNPPLAHWDTGEYPAVGASVQESEVSASGFEVVLKNGSIYQTLINNVIKGESYVLSFKAKGESLSFSAGGIEESVALTDTWEKYTIKIEATTTDNIFGFTNADCVLCEPQLERGTIATAWGNSPFDNTSDRVYYQAMKPISDAIQGSTVVVGGLVLSNLIMVEDSQGEGEGLDNVQAFLNGGELGMDDEHKKLILAGGIPTLSESGSDLIAERAKEAATRIYEDGTIVSKSAEIEGTIIAKSGNIAGFDIADNWFSSKTDYYETRISPAVIYTQSTGQVVDYVEYDSIVRMQAYPSSGTNYHALLSEVDITPSTMNPDAPAIALYLSAKGANTAQQNLFGQEIGGNYAAYAADGMFAGLRPKCVLLADGQIYRCSAVDHTLISNSLGGVTNRIYLPEDPQDGQVIKIWKGNTHTLYIHSIDGKTIHRMNVLPSEEHGIEPSWMGYIDLLYHSSVGGWLMVVTQSV